jgi:2-polyprenyl-6-hydroxyphenyl methylase/3-demethylubiquinone-9 3-methyltransferase
MRRKALTSGRPSGSIPARRPEKARIHTGGVARLQLVRSLTSAKQDGPMVNRRAGSVDTAEVERFARLGADWGTARGPMAALHKLNPVRLAYIRDRACERFGRDAGKLGCLRGLRMLDIGCGGGILSEPLARLGAEMVGADPAEENIEIARAHAAENDVAVDYRAVTAEALAEAGETFDVVLAMEVVEHVTEVAPFVAACASMVKPGGLMVAATLNRTLKSFALAIVGAEYVLRWVPRGTHRWDKFVTPRELERAVENAGLRVIGERGVIYNPLADRWQLSSDMDVNYMLAAARDS